MFLRMLSEDKWNLEAFFDAKSRTKGLLVKPLLLG